jgi:hypothetical protein
MRDKDTRLLEEAYKSINEAVNVQNIYISAIQDAILNANAQALQSGATEADQNTSLLGAIKFLQDNGIIPAQTAAPAPAAPAQTGGNDMGGYDPATDPWADSY